ncbi:hypothetical protein HMI54_008487 [Coelomomyces lativittatus]|nr:hypothetical protein HMI54_008487 [Coelomomyces lativittatus]KAJ1515461.1 hypothetical protein HMI56_004547 [Coelomomyces lativittatus]KAJ1516251.1 hypothetical protein HMI55_002693 [Coelomomyces lativittatus]
MLFRIRSKLGMHTLSGSPTTFGDLHQLILTTLNLPLTTQLNVKLSYPGSSSTSFKDVAKDTLLSLLPISDRDVMMVEWNEQLNSTPLLPNFSSTPDKVPDSMYVNELGGSLVVRPSADDNQCLFHCISYLIDTKKNVMQLRTLITEWIQTHSDKYSEPILGKPIQQYQEWIMKPTSWGGAIELAIFSEYYQVEIDSVDIQTLRIDKFGENLYAERVIVLYNGIHYDSIALTPSLNASPEFDTTRFSVVRFPTLLTHALELAMTFHKEHRYTNQSEFSLRCDQCHLALVGHTEALAHAKQTGHSQFVEYK